jgi:hypothetical protein
MSWWQLQGLPEKEGVMYLEAKVQTAKVGNFYDGLELDVVDRRVVRPAGGRPQYKCKVVRGWPGVDEMKQLKKDGADEQRLADAAAIIQLPQEDAVFPLEVVDITGKGVFRLLICELIQQNA